MFGEIIQITMLVSSELYSRMEWITEYFFLEVQALVVAFTSMETRGLELFLEENAGFFTHLKKHHREVRCSMREHNLVPRVSPLLGWEEERPWERRRREHYI